MRFPERLKRVIHVAAIDRSTSPVTYREPVAYRVNILASDSDAAVQAYGIGYAERLFAVCDRKYAGAIREMDLVYVFEQPPSPDDEPPATTAAEPGETTDPVTPPGDGEEPGEEWSWWDGFASGADFIVESKVLALGSVRLVLVRRKKSGAR